MLIDVLTRITGIGMLIYRSCCYIVYWLYIMYTGPDDNVASSNGGSSSISDSTIAAIIGGTLGFIVIVLVVISIIAVGVYIKNRHSTAKFNSFTQ